MQVSLAPTVLRLDLMTVLSGATLNIQSVSNLDFNGRAVSCPRPRAESEMLCFLLKVSQESQPQSSSLCQS